MNSAEDLDFTVDAQNLYREENITDVKVASIRRLVPIQTDGSDDPKREALFMGHTQLMTPSGPLPIQCPLNAKTLDEALAEFPGAMKETVNQLIDEAKKAQFDSNRIVVPGDQQDSKIIY
jgi:hypothetical protein